MRYNLRTMLIAGAVAPPALAWLWIALGYYLILAVLLPAMYVIALVLIIDDRT